MTVSRFTQPIVFKLNLRAEEIELFPQRTNMKPSRARQSPVHLKISWHSFKEQIKQNTLKKEISLKYLHLLSCQVKFTVLQSTIYFFLFDFSIFTNFPFVLCRNHILGHERGGSETAARFVM